MVFIAEHITPYYDFAKVRQFNGNGNDNGNFFWRGGTWAMGRWGDGAILGDKGT